MQRAHIGRLASAGGLVALVSGLVVVDPRMRDQLRSVASGQPTGELVAASSRFEELLFVAIDAVRAQSIEHAPMVIFALAAMVLVLFMLRT